MAYFFQETLFIRPGPIPDALFLPPSKSQTVRALIFASCASGQSTIWNWLDSLDTRKLIEACRSFGARIEVFPDRLEIEGQEKLKAPLKPLDVGNSGLALRLLTALCSLLEDETEITGDQSITEQRPMQPLIDALQDMKMEVVSTKGDGYAPLSIRGSPLSGQTTVQGADSQFVSSLLLRAAKAEGTSVIHVQSPGEKPWVDLTLSWLSRLKIPWSREGYTSFQVTGRPFAGFTYTVPGDLSTLAFPLVAALIGGKELSIYGADLSDPQGDKKVVDHLFAMGGNIEITPQCIKVYKSMLHGLCADLNDCPDALPILAVAACFATEPSSFYNVAIARTKECDRLRAMREELGKMGGSVEELEDGLSIVPQPLHGAFLDARGDHRVALAWAIAAANSRGVSRLKGASSIDKTWRNFFSDLRVSSADDNLILTGYPRSGKSSYGRQLAKEEGRHFIDLDALLTKRWGLSPKALYLKEGPSAFRAKEEEVLLSLKGVQNAVIALGGGTPLSEMNRQCIKTLGKVLYLQSDPQTIIERWKREGAPLSAASAPPEQAFWQMAKEREAIYLDIADEVISP